MHIRKCAILCGNVCCGCVSLIIRTSNLQGLALSLERLTKIVNGESHRNLLRIQHLHREVTKIVTIRHVVTMCVTTTFQWFSDGTCDAIPSLMTDTQKEILAAINETLFELSKNDELELLKALFAASYQGATHLE